MARPKLPMWLFPLVKVRPPPPWCIQRRTQLLSLGLELVEMPSSRPSFPCWEGWDVKQFCLESQSGQEIKYTWVPTTCYCCTNIVVVGTFLSQHELLTPICTRMLQNKGGRQGKGLYVSCACPQQRFARFARWIASLNIGMFARVCANTNIWYCCLRVCTRLRCCPCCLSSSWHCCPCCDGIVAVNAQVSLPLLQWQLSFLSQWRCCHCWCTGVSTIVELASMPSLLVVELASLPLSWWHYCRWCAGIFVIIAIALVALLTMVLLPLLMCRRLAVVELVLSPLYQWQCRPWSTMALLSLL